MMIPAQDLLRIADLEAVYGDAILALRGVSLCLPEGSIIALLGSNGAGNDDTEGGVQLARSLTRRRC
jgi:branched-chain amino acid transport system ATP-binding protein